ncbi:pyranose oxidase [Actinoplanes sp. OR16]|uniref:GMC oxidoreductase n=1 Tax=Actinoplanes sp. OR16 TaxID=946334 RepID=UPI000F714513|nr:GMC oxidoreductase [Actinoplanes sp. OR16]BBH69763.1 pyranose oxidase [Actinoplanes sp. OR16]
MNPIPTAVDVAIIGSGPAGATYARILSERAPGLRVALFEAGPLVSDPPGAHVKNIRSPEERAAAQRLSEGPRPTTGTDTLEDYAGRLQRPGTFLLPEDGDMPAAAMSANVGGMAAHWTGACPRPGESERIGFLPAIDQWLTEAERLLGVSAEVLADAPLAGEVRRRLAAALDADRASDRTVRPMPLAVRAEPDGHLHWSGSDVVFGDATRSNPGFSLHPSSLVTRVLTEDDAVRGVLVRTVEDGVEHQVAARFVVVAADSLRTPQVLFASGIRPPALGRHLNDQPQIVYAVQLRDIPSTAAHTGISGVSWVPFTDAHPFHGQVMQLDASPVPFAGEVVPGSIVGLGWFCAKDIQASDRIEFSDTEVDDHGMPAMRIHYSLTSHDLANLETAEKEIQQAAAALGDPLDDRPPLRFPAGASLHYQGSVRMGPVDDGTSVCGPDSRVWGVKGLYVAGNGVIPTATACNPTLTGVALAVGGALAICEEI